MNDTNREKCLLSVLCSTIGRSVEQNVKENEGFSRWHPASLRMNCKLQKIERSRTETLKPEADRNREWWQKYKKRKERKKKKTREGEKTERQTTT